MDTQILDKMWAIFIPVNMFYVILTLRFTHSTSEGRRVDGPTEEMQRPGSLPEKLLRFLPNKNKFGNLCGKTSRADASESVSFWLPLQWQSACL